MPVPIQQDDNSSQMHGETDGLLQQHDYQTELRVNLLGSFSDNNFNAELFRVFERIAQSQWPFRTRK